MKIISYAQNFEDVMLLRALGHLDQGCYIDIGAQDPTVDSVSRAFHERGWQGLHIEPTREYAEKLRRERPGDEVRQVAVGREVGQLTLFEVTHTGLSTGDPDIADEYRRDGADVSETTVDLITLDELFDAHSDRPVHWLKIDVEGMEAEVIAGWGTSAVRPWLIVVESTYPGSQQETYQEWEPGLLAKGYQQVYFDGINRFYLSDEHPELAPAFSAPPNVFDRFVLSGKGSHSFCEQVQHETWLAEEKGADFARQAYQANTRLAQLEPELEHQREQVDSLQEQLDSLREIEKELQSVSARFVELESRHNVVVGELDAVYRSRSWRLTAPVRAITGLRNVARWKTWFSREGRHHGLNRAVYHAVRVVGGSPRLKQFGIRMLRACPPLFNMVRVRFHQGAMARAGGPSATRSDFGTARLTPRQQHLKAQLNSAIRGHGEKE